MKKIFISGSISIKELPEKIKKNIDNIIKNEMKILVGDAKGIDELVQKYCKSKNYNNVVIYTINPKPRTCMSRLFNIKVVEVSEEIKKERQRQMEKDKKMSMDSDYSLVIWDSCSKGSYSNILRALEYQKIVKVFLNENSTFLKKDKTEKNEIEYIYRMSNGYTASEIVEYLKNKMDCEPFENTRKFNEYLKNNKIIENINKVWLPIGEYEKYMITTTHKGKKTGIKFKNEFIDFIEQKRKIQGLER